MFFRIIKHDLKKKKLMNILILLFIIMAAMFSASGLNNTMTVMTGTDYYFEKAGIGDYDIVSKKDDKIFEILDNEESVESYTYEDCFLGQKKNVDVDGKDLDMNNNVFLQSIDNTSMKFFNSSDEEITKIEKGKVYITGAFLENNDLNVGDMVTVVVGDDRIDLEIAGLAKDAFLGSKFLGNIRFLMNQEDYSIIENSENKDGLAECNIFYVKTENVKEMPKILSDATQIYFHGGTTDKIKLSYVMDMIIAFIVLVLSICLVIVAVLILKFTITFTLNEEYREIGVMKAIGINNSKIRRLYIIKYMFLAVLGAVIGFFISIPFGKLLISSTTKYMVLGNSSGLTLNVIGSVFVIVVTIIFAYFYTRKVKKATPVDAIRNGQTGERYKTKTIYKMKNSHIRLNLYLAINDILSSPRRYITIIASMFVCMIFVLGIVITTDTMKSKNLITTFGTQSDLYYMGSSEMSVFKYEDPKDLNEKVIKQHKEILEENNLACDISVDLLYKTKVSFEGNKYNLTCIQGVNTKAEDYEYKEGIAPTRENEIALTYKIVDMTGAKIGDKVKIDLGYGEKEYLVTAYFQTLNNTGELIRLNENAECSFQNIAGSNMYQIDFLDNPSDEEIKNRIPKVKELLNADEVMTAEGFCRKYIGVVDTMEAVQYLLLSITIIVLIFVTLLMELSFVTSEKSQIALLKAVGFRDSQIMKWHVYRFVIATIIAEVLAIVFVKPITRLWCNPIFGMMGANDINYYINPNHIFIVYPGIVLISTIIIAFIASISTKKIKCSDTANIE